MTEYVMRPRCSKIELSGRSWISKLLAQMFKHRQRRLSVDRISDHLLRDAGLERVGGFVRSRRH